MNKIIPLFFLILITLPLVVAVPSNPNDIRQSREDSLCAEEVIATREYMQQFGEETDERFIYHKEQVEKDIRQQLRLFKFTNGLVTFISIFMAFAAHDLFKKRRDRKIKKLDESLAKQARERQ